MDFLVTAFKLTSRCQGDITGIFFFIRVTICVSKKKENNFNKNLHERKIKSPVEFNWGKYNRTYKFKIYVISTAV